MLLSSHNFIKVSFELIAGKGVSKVTLLIVTVFDYVILEQTLIPFKFRKRHVFINFLCYTVGKPFLKMT